MTARRASIPARALAGLGCALVLALAAGCSSKPKPAPLVNFQTQSKAGIAWRVSIGSVKFPMQPVVRGDQVFVASQDGVVRSLEVATGALRWQASAGKPLSAGVGADGRWAAVVTQDQELVVFDRGQKAWSKTLPSRTVTPPLVAGERVFVIGVDRVAHAFDAADGGRLWMLQRPGTEALTLAQPGLLAVHADTLLVALGPALVGVDPNRGTTRWEVPLANPRGSNEIERLNDLLGPPVRLGGGRGDVFCMRAFQSAVGCIDARRRILSWQRNATGVKPLGGDDELLAGSDGADRVTAWRTAAGELAWTNETLLYRGLSTPWVTPGGVWFGDSEGLVHVLGRDDGRTIARLSTDGTPFATPIVPAGTLGIGVTRGGTVVALRE